MQLRTEEYFIKIILENCFRDKFGEIKVSDKPDLRSKTYIGIEATNCMPKDIVEAMKRWRRVAKNGGTNSERDIERLRQLGIEYNGGSFCWNQGWYSPNLDESPIRFFLEAVEKKVKKLNSSKANYAPMESYELFVNSFIFIPMRQMCDVVERLKIINDKPKKFDTIYLLTNEQKLLMFERKSDSLREIPLYGWLDRWAETAKQICREKKENDET